MSPQYEKIVKALAGGNMKSICRAFFANPHLRQEAVSKVSRMVNDECSLLCKKNAQPVSLFRHTLEGEQQSYVWGAVLYIQCSLSNNIHKKVCASVCVCVWHGKET